MVEILLMGHKIVKGCELMRVICSTDKEEPLNVHSLARSKHVHMFCRHCDTAILHAGIQKKKSDIPFLTKEEQVKLK